MATEIRIIPVDTADLVAAVRDLFLEYAASLGFALRFQAFDDELAHLVEQYGPPSGVLLVALRDDEIAGCVGVRRFSNGVCEMKRLYVRPAFRGHGVGRRLAEAAVEQARRLGYTTMRLDTVPAMVEAIAMYRAMGFVEIPSYRVNPVEGAVFMELDLAGNGGGKR